MKILTALLVLAAGASAAGQAPCAKAPTAAATSFFLEPATAAARDTVATVRLCLVSTRRVGSYMAVVSFDSSRMRVAQVDARGGVQVANVNVPGIIRIAGAAPSGFANGTLALIALKPAGKTLDRLALVVSEASTTTGGSLLSDATVSGWPRSTVSRLQPVIDSISPRSGALEAERVTDIAIYGKGFAPTGNLVLFGIAEVRGLASEAGGTIIRFSAPGVRVGEDKVPVRVTHDGKQSNAVTFTVKDPDHE
jgi:hypothetical protein